MAKGETLFRLVKALSGSEKKYFKLFASRHVIKGKNNYLKLFEEIEKQLVYDEKKIFEYFAGQSYVRHLARHRHYLFNMILKSLQAFYSEATIELKLKNLLQQASILSNKNLPEHAFRLLQKARGIAVKSCKDIQYLEIIKAEQKMLRSFVSIRPLKGNLMQSAEQEADILKRITNYNEYQKLANRIFILDKSGGGLPRDEKTIEKFRNEYNNPLMRNVHNALSLPAKDVFYYIQTAFFLITEDLNRALEAAKKRIRLLDKYPFMKEDDPEKYIAATINYLTSCLRLHRYGAFVRGTRKCKNEIRKMNAYKLSGKLLQFNAIVYNLELSYYIRTGNFKEGEYFIKHEDAIMGKHFQKFDKLNQLVIYYNMAYIYFGSGHYALAASSINKILNDTDENIRQDIYAFARILNLIIHYELGNRELLEYIVKSTYRFLHRRNRLYKSEQLIVAFIQKEIPAVISKKDELDAFRKLKKEFQKIMHLPFEQKIMEYFDILSWLESKTGQKSFASIIQAKVKRTGK